VRIHARGAWHTVPVVGAVNMDQLTVDAGSIVGSWGAPQELFGAPVELLGTDRRHVTHPLEVARVAGRKPYEILCGLSSRLPRVHEGALVIDRSTRSVSVPRAAAASPDAGE
jgi:alanine racemase